MRAHSGFGRKPLLCIQAQLQIIRIMKARGTSGRITQDIGAVLYWSSALWSVGDRIGGIQTPWKRRCKNTAKWKERFNSDGNGCTRKEVVVTSLFDITYISYPAGKYFGKYAKYRPLNCVTDNQLFVPWQADSSFKPIYMELKCC